MAKFRTIKTKRKICECKSKGCKCRIITVPRKYRINPDEIREREIERIIERINQLHYSSSIRFILKSISDSKFRDFCDHINKAYSIIY